MKFAEIVEGMMKRSDPYISGDKDGVRPTPSKPSPFSIKISKLASQANVPVSKVEAAWETAKSQVDPRLSNRWALVTLKTKQILGIA